MSYKSASSLDFEPCASASLGGGKIHYIPLLVVFRRAQMKIYRQISKTFVSGKNWIPHGVYAKILEDSGTVVKITTSDLEKSISISSAEFMAKFEETRDYPKEVLQELDSPNIKYKGNDIVRLVENFYPSAHTQLLLVALAKAYQDAYTAPGSSSCLTVEAYLNFQSGTLNAGKLSTIGDPIFNRRSRWAPVAEEDKWADRGAPAPIGIRPEDFAHLVECNKIYLELLRQIFSMEGLDEVPDQIQDYIGKEIVPGSHFCFYCGETMHIELFADQAYKSKQHAINFCHRDPSEKNSRTRCGNVYYGHTSCNRTQGGLSEAQRIRDGLRLLNLYPDDYLVDPTISDLLKSLDKRI
jgi:hypothetical protein